MGEAAVETAVERRDDDRTAEGDDDKTAAEIHQASLPSEATLPDSLDASNAEPERAMLGASTAEPEHAKGGVPSLQTVDEITDGILGDIIAELLREKVSFTASKDHGGEEQNQIDESQPQLSCTSASAAASESQSPSFGATEPKNSKRKKLKKEKKAEKYERDEDINADQSAGDDAANAGILGDEETTTQKQKKQKKSKKDK